MRGNVGQSNVVDCDKGVCRAVFIKWIDHAATWAATAWLKLLLWTDVNTPPNWIMNFDVLIKDICDFSALIVPILWISWVSLDVNCFEWIMEFDVSISDSIDAVVLGMWGNSANCHSSTEINFDVFN